MLGSYKMTSSATTDPPALVTSIIGFCVFAVVLNLIFISVVWASNKVKSSIDIFLINLSISDVFMAGIALPLRLKYGTHDKDGFQGGDGLCKFIMFMPLLTVSSSVMTMVAIAVDRFRVIVLRKFLSTERIILILVVIWCFACVCSGPQLYEYSIYQKLDTDVNKTFPSCGSFGIVENFESIYAGTVLLVVYIIPLTLITVCYTVLAKNVKKSSENPNVVGGQVSKVRVKVVKMLIAITSAFALLWAPYFAVFGIEEILGSDDTAETENWLHVIKNIFVTFSTISNPLLNFLCDKSLKKSLARYVRKVGSFFRNDSKVHVQETEV